MAGKQDAGRPRGEEAEAAAREAVESFPDQRYRLARIRKITKTTPAGVLENLGSLGMGEHYRVYLGTCKKDDKEVGYLSRVYGLDPMIEWKGVVDGEEVSGQPEEFPSANDPLSFFGHADKNRVSDELQDWLAARSKREEAELYCEDLDDDYPEEEEEEEDAESKAEAVAEIRQLETELGDLHRRARRCRNHGVSVPSSIPRG